MPEGMEYHEWDYAPPGPRRALVYLYADDRDTRVTVVDGLTTDDNLRRLYEAARELHADAWVLHTEDLLPSWWREVYEIRAEHFSTGRDLVTWPRADGAARRMGLSIDQVHREVDGWRVQRTRDGGGRILRNVKVRETRVTERPTLSPPDTHIRNPEAFPADPDRAMVAAIRDADPPITRAGLDEALDRLTVTVVGSYSVIPVRGRVRL